MPIWSRLCDCTKGTPEAKSMISILQTAANSLNSINVLVRSLVDHFPIPLIKVMLSHFATHITFSASVRSVN